MGAWQTSWAGLPGSSGQWTPTWSLTAPACASPVAAVAMLTPRIAALLTLLLASSSLGRRVRRPPRPPSPSSTIQPKANFDAQQVELAAVGQGPARSAAPSPGRSHTACSPVRRDLAPGGRGLPVSLPAAAGPPGRGHHSARGSSGLCLGPLLSSHSALFPVERGAGVRSLAWFQGLSSSRWLPNLHLEATVPLTQLIKPTASSPFQPEFLRGTSSYK